MFTSIKITKKDNKPLFNKLRFIALAVNDVDIDHVTSKIFVDQDKTAYSFNGIRIHAIENCLLDCGYYDVLNVTKSYVELKAVEHNTYLNFPDMTMYFNAPSTESYRFECGNVSYCHKISIFIHALTTKDTYVNYKYIIDIVEHAEENIIVYTCQVPYCTKTMYKIVTDIGIAFLIPETLY